MDTTTAATFQHDAVYNFPDIEGFEEPPISALPFSILMSIIGLVDNTRSRNAASLVSRLWKEAERLTRFSLTLRGHIFHLLEIPLSFTHVQELDLTEISPWGSSLMQAGNGVEDVLQRAFPLIRKLRLYSREIWDIDMMARIWPSLEEVHIVRWHARTDLQTSSLVSTELAFLIKQCKALKVVDLSDFFCWVEDIPPALEACETAQHLRVLSLQKMAPDGFTNASLIKVLTACHLLEQLEFVCDFNPSYEDSVDDTSMIAIAENCPKMRILKMVDYEEQSRPRIARDDRLTSDVRLTHSGLEVLFTGLPLLEEFALVSAHPILATGRVLAALPVLCKRLRKLELGCFLNACVRPEDFGFAHCSNLTSLSIRRCRDLTDESLIAIASCCRLLNSFTISSCRAITAHGLRLLATGLASTLEDVSVSDCYDLGVASLLRALEPVRSTLRRLHLDLIAADRQRRTLARIARPEEDLLRQREGPPVIRRRVSDGQGESSSLRTQSNTDDPSRYVCGMIMESADAELLDCIIWPKLEELSLWVELSVQLDILLPLAFTDCKMLQSVRIKVEGDCSIVQGPRPGTAFGLHLMQCLPNLQSLSLDLGNLRGYTSTMPIIGPAPMHVWERHYLLGIQQLRVETVDYWPPKCRESGQRAIALASAGILSMCLHMRKLTVHGTVTEHVLNLLQRARSLRDTLFKTDYYPAPEDQNVESWLRFQSALLKNKIED